MSLPSFSVRRPVMTTMATLIVVLLGGVALRHLPIDLLPKVEMPTVSVSTSYENASPEVMERLVTQVVEETVAVVPGVEEITSISSTGNSSVRVRFGWGTDLDAASNDVRDRLDREANEFPEEALRPRLSKFDIAGFPIVILGVGSDLDPVEMTELIDLQVQYRIERIEGVASVDLWGEYEREIRVSLHPDRIMALGLPLDGVLDAIRDANLDLPAGEVEQGRYEVTLRAPAEFTDLDQIRSTVITMRGGAAVTLGQIADVVDTHRKRTRIVRINGKRGLRLGVRKQADANTVEVASRVLAEVERINEDYPQIELVPVVNQGNFIERSIANVARSVVYGGGLAVVVLLFFLRNLRSTLVISLAIPISVIATFALIYFAGFTLNLMTLGGLALGVGMMVDSSIVVLENIFRRRDEEKEGRVDAAVRGASEVGPAIVASTITTLVIFVPLIFVEGVAGILFSELAYVIAFSLVCSLLVSLSLVPMLSARLLRSPEEMHRARPGWVDRLAGAAEGMFRRIDEGYRDLIRLALRHRYVTVGMSAVMLGASLLLVPLIGTEMLPPSDEGEVRITGEMEVGTRLGIVDRQTALMEKIVYEAIPERLSAVASIGPSGWRPDEVAMGEIQLSLVPAAERDRSNVEVADEIRELLDGRIPGMTIRTRAPQGQFLLDRLIGGDNSLTIEVRGYDLEILNLLSQRVADAIAEVPGLADVRTSRSAGMPQEFIRVDREKAADLGLTVRRVAEALETAVAGTQAGEFRTQGNSHRILVQLKDAERLSIDEILDITLTGAGGEEVSLRNVVTVEPGRGPILIDRKDQQRLVTVSANVAGRDMGSIARDVEAVLDQIPRPVGYDLIIAGNFEEQQRAFNELLISLGLALVMVYMVLASQYESLRDPLVVILSVPMAAVGVLLMLFLTGTTLNIQSYIGCIMLGGIVVNNAILLVDQAGQLRAKGMLTGEAIAEAGRRRLRPILMTTMTTILGLMPLALGIGEGADAQAPLARAVVGGLTSSTLVTLVLIPAVYSLFHPDPKGGPA